MTTATSGVLARFPWLLPVRNSCELRDAVTRTSDRGHLTEAETNVIEVVMSTFVFSFQHKDVEDSSLVVGVIDSD